ncbi:MAG: thioredoxin family protein [Leadbetterella sp.]
MKKIVTILWILIVSITSYSQAVKFDKATWKSILEKASSNKKPIFLDIYASWCGPCKLLEKQTYPNGKVGKYMNANFINVKLDGEIGEGVTLAEQFKVDSYPTLIYLNSSGEEVYRVSGFQEPEEFIKVSKLALEETKKQPLSEIEKQIAGGDKSFATLKNYINRRKTSKPILSTETALFNDFATALSSKNDLSNEDYLLFWDNSKCMTFDSPGYEFLKKNTTKIAEVGEQAHTVSNAVVIDRMNTFIAFNDMERAFQEKNEQKLQSAIQVFRKYTGKNKDWFPFGENTIYKTESDFYKVEHNDSKFIDVTKAYVNKTYSEKQKPDDLLKSFGSMYESFKKSSLQDKEDNKENNEYVKKEFFSFLSQDLNAAAWGVYEITDEKKHLKEALWWSKKSLELEENSAYFDTYAQINYALGNKAEAIKFQKKAIEAATLEGNDTEEFMDVLTKMEDGKSLKD